LQSLVVAAQRGWPAAQAQLRALSADRAAAELGAAALGAAEMPAYWS